MPEKESCIFLRNVGIYLEDYIFITHRRWHCKFHRREQMNRNTFLKSAYVENY